MKHLSSSILNAPSISGLCLALITMFCCGSCADKGQTTTDVTSEVSQEGPSTGKNMIMGMVVLGEEDSDCAYLIKTKAVAYPLDPIDLEERFQKDRLKVMFEYLPLRRPNRCGDAAPVQILAMEEV